MDPAPSSLVAEGATVGLLRGNAHPTALVVEDIREADVALRECGYTCERLTHNELLSSAGTEYTGKLLKGDYSLLWISTPNDWHARIPTAKTTTHWQRVSHWIKKAHALGILLVLFGPPGFLWKLPNIRETLQESAMSKVRLRLCHFGDKFDNKQQQPSGSYLQLATSKHIPTTKWQCNCGVDITDHVLDWYGRDSERADWRRKISAKYAKEVCKALAVPGTVHTRVHAIQDGMTPPFPITVFPTEGRLRQKERLMKLKEQGLKPPKKKFVTEPGTDDCGDDISGLGKDVVLLSSDVLFEDIESSEDEYGYEIVPLTIRESTTNVYSAIAHLCYGKYNNVDLLELCGGAGRISQVAFRRGLRSGGNLDLVTGCDLGDPTTQKAINHYLRTCYVMVTILQPNCRSVGSFASYNAVANRPTWLKHHREDLPHLSYCGEVALMQMRLGRFFLREQPAGTFLDYVDPWPQVQANESVMTCLSDQCMAGAIDEYKVPVQKKTEFTANDLSLLKPLERLICNGAHQHATPTGKALEKLKVYPWKLCGVIVNGIQALKLSLQTSYMLDGVHGNVHPILPTVGTQGDPPDVPVSTKKIITCPACEACLRKESDMHTRGQGCKYPHVMPKPWQCPACKSMEERYRNPQARDPGHTYEPRKCRFEDYGAAQRVGAHPRDPRPLATQHPTSEQSSHDATLQTPGEHGDVPPAFGETEASSSADRGRPFGATDSEPRVRRTYSTTGSGPQRLPDWSRFNVQVSLKNLRTYEPAVVQRELRKLHLRWWHASATKMRIILQAAGLDEARLAMIKPIVDTCRECRAWQKRGKIVMSSTDITIKFCEKGECDLMFYKRFIAFHIIDRAIRISGGCPASDRYSETLLNAYWQSWVQHHGPFQILYSDGELGLNNESSRAELKRLGTTLEVRAPDQHARIAESRQAMLRHVMHMIEEELKRHGKHTHPLALPFPRLYAEALFVVNAFTFYNGVSPYNALTGRQPAFLPDLENIDFPKGSEHSDHRREQRIREAGLEAITQSTAVAKVNRALKTNTTPDGNRLYKAGDLIDYHRPTATKDEHGGWNGPYPVVRNEPDKGRVICKHGEKEIFVRYPDARLTLFIESILTMDLGMDNMAMDLMLDYVGRLAHGKTPVTFGYAVVLSHRKQPRLVLTTATKKAPKVYLALQFLIRNYFRISNVFAIRLGHGVKQVSNCDYAQGCTLIHYQSDVDPKFKYYETSDVALDIRDVTGSNNTRFLQCLIREHCPCTVDEPTEVGNDFPTTQQPGASEELHGDVHPQQPSDPPTPLEIGGELPTIQEDDAEQDDDALTIEAFYAELMSEVPMEQDTTYEELYANVYYMPVQTMPESTVLFTVEAGEDQVQHGDVLLESMEVLLSDPEETDDSHACDTDDVGDYIELCFTTDMAPIVLNEEQYAGLQDGDMATMRVYISANVKRAVVVKEDDLLSKSEMWTHAGDVSKATVTELKTWIANTCFKKCLLKDAQNVMTSRYVAKWKWVKVDGVWKRIIRMRLVLRGFMDLEAFSLDTFSGTAKRTSQRTLASEAACHPDFISASLDIDKAFLKGFTYKELAEATGEKERMVCFRLPPGSATYLRQFPGFEDFDETKHCLQCVKPGTGTKDAPRAFSLKLNKITKQIGLRSLTFDPEYEVKKDLQTAKHVDDVNMTGTEPQIDQYRVEVEKVFGPCKMTKHQYTNCGVQTTMLANHDVVLDQDEYIKTMRPIVSGELTGAAADQKATKTIADLFVSLRGALAYTTLTQAWIQVYIVSLQRVQEPTNLDVRRLNAITRKLQKEPQKLVFVAMACKGEVDLHADSGYRRITDAEDEKGYGMRGLCLLRRGERRNNKVMHGNVHLSKEAIHLLDSVCKSHRLTVRSSYGAEMIAVSHGYDDAFPTLITLVELKHGVLKPEELKRYREEGGMKLRVTMTTDAESVYKSLTSRDLKTPAEKTLLGHVVWIRELLQLSLIEAIQWCDTRDMTADGHTKGCIERTLLLELMRGIQSFKHPVKRYSPFRKAVQPLSESLSKSHGNVYLCWTAVGDLV